MKTEKGRFFNERYGGRRTNGFEPMPERAVQDMRRSALAAVTPENLAAGFFGVHGVCKSL